MFRRYLAAGAVLSVALVAGAGLATGQGPQGSVEGASNVLALPATPLTTVSAVGRPASAAPKDVAAATAVMGVAEPKLARGIDGREAYLGTSSDGGSICLAVESSGGRVTTTCQSPAAVSQGMLWVTIGSSDGSRDLVGVAPDGIETVSVTSENGTESSLPVRNNVYSATDVAVRRIEWADSNKNRADLRLP